MSEHLPDGESRNLRILAERMRSRRTTNLFLKQEVSRQLLLDAIELARWAPNHHLTEPWHFYLFGDEMKAAPEGQPHQHTDYVPADDTFR